MSGLENLSDAQTKFLGPEPLLRHTKMSNWVLVDDDKSRWRRRSPRTRSEVRDACTKVVEKVATHGMLMGGVFLRRRSPRICSEDRDA